MKGMVFLGDRTAEVREFPDPKPGPGQVVVRMKVAAICGSDLHTYRKSRQEIVAMGRENRIPGHEPSGIVEAIGEGVRHVKVGDRISVYHWLGCGHCEHCLAGYMMWCKERKGLGGLVDGSDADLLLIDERNCMPLPEDLSFVDGAFIACIAGTTYAALRRLNGMGGDTLAVFGLGPVGLTGALLAKSMGMRVLGIEVNPYRKDFAKRIGIDAVVDPQECKTADAIYDLTDGKGADLVLETSGSKLAQGQTVEVAKNGGKIVFVGFGNEQPSLVPAPFIHKQLTLMGSWVLPIHYYWDLVRLIRGKKVNLEQLVTHRFRIEDASKAMEIFDAGNTGKVIFVWD